MLTAPIPCPDCGRESAQLSNGLYHGFCNPCLSDRYIVPEGRGRKAYFYMGQMPLDAADIHGQGWVAAVTGTAVARATRLERYKGGGRQISNN
jgi:hypothetical protein